MTLTVQNKNIELKKWTFKKKESPFWKPHLISSFHKLNFQVKLLRSKALKKNGLIDQANMEISTLGW